MIAQSLLNADCAERVASLTFGESCNERATGHAGIGCLISVLVAAEMKDRTHGRLILAID